MRKIFPLIFLFNFLLAIALLSAFPNTAPVFCREMGYTVKNDLCIFPDGEDCKLWDFFNYNSNQCLTAKNYIKNLSCSAQGEYVLPGHKCCEGLIEIKALNRISNGTCKDPEPLGSWRVCSNCGNSVCDTGENNCNCDKDCKENEGFNNYTRLKSECEKINGYCRLWSVDCKENFQESNLDPSYCFSSKEKCCVPTNFDNRTECEKLGGYCDTSTTCKNGYKNSGFDTPYCKGVASSICCLKDSSVLACPDIVEPNCPQGAQIESQGKDDKDCPKPGKCIKTLSNGRKAEIKIMPETASSVAIERLGNLGFNVTLKEVGKGIDIKPVYDVSGDKEVKVFGFIKTKAKVSAEVNAETGDVLSIKKPWWLFLASEGN